MSATKTQRTLMTFSTILIGSVLLAGCSFFQPVERIEKVYNFVDYDTPALRLAKPIEAELLRKDENGKWVSIGKGIIPAGAYIKGRAPKPKTDAEIEEGD